MKKIVLVLIIFGVFFIETTTEKILEYKSMKSMETIFVEDMNSYNINAANVQNNEQLVLDLSDFIKANDQFMYSFNFNETIPVQIHSMPNNISYPIVDGDSYTNNEIPEALIGLNFEKLNNLDDQKLKEAINYNEITAIATARVGTPTFTSDFNSIIILDMDTLNSYPQLFYKLISINISNPNNLAEFAKINDDFQNILRQHGVSVVTGNTKFSGIQTSAKQFGQQLVIQLSGIVILLMTVLLIAIRTMIEQERRKYAIYKLLGYRKNKIFITTLKEKSKMIVKTVIASISIQYVIAYVFKDLFFIPNIYVLVGYILSNIIILLIMVIFLYINIYHRTIREEL